MTPQSSRFTGASIFCVAHPAWAMGLARHLGSSSHTLDPAACPDRCPEAGDVRGGRPEIHLEVAADHHVGAELPGPQAQPIPAGRHRHPEIGRAEKTLGGHPDGGDHLDHLMRPVGRVCGERDRHRASRAGSAAKASSPAMRASRM